MRAAVHTTYGPPSVVEIQDAAIPSPGPQDVLVEVRCTTVNRTDCGLRAAKPWFSRAFTGLTGPRHTINGGEFAGVDRDAEVGEEHGREYVAQRIQASTRHLGDLAREQQPDDRRNADNADIAAAALWQEQHGQDCEQCRRQPLQGAYPGGQQNSPVGLEVRDQRGRQFRSSDELS